MYRMDLRKTMKAKKALRKALEQPWLYNEQELTRLKKALNDAEEMGVQELWHRRTTQGFANYPQELLQEKKTYLDPERKGRYTCTNMADEAKEILDNENVPTERLPL